MRLYDTLCAAGAQFDIDAAGDLKTTLDGVASITTFAQADSVSRAVLTLSEEIVAVMRRRAAVPH